AKRANSTLIDVLLSTPIATVTPSSPVSSSPVGSGPSRGGATKPRGTGAWRQWSGAATAASLLLVGAAVALRQVNAPPAIEPTAMKAAARTATTPPQRAAVLDAVAVLYDSDGAVWHGREPALPSGTALAAGARMRLESGLAEIVFRTGARVVLQAPAKVRLLSDMELRLDSGRLSAKVPPDAVGFAVRTDSARILDLGTEFGVAARADGESDVVVFDGEVIVSPTGKPAENRHLLTGGAVRTSGSRLLAPSEQEGIDADRFTRALAPQRGRTRGELLGNFRNDFLASVPNGVCPSPRWSYLWNANGPHGDPAHYSGLAWNGTWGYTTNGAGVFPAPPPAKSLNLRDVGGHPGPDAESSPMHDFGHGPVVAFQVPEDGDYAIAESWITRCDRREVDAELMTNEFGIDVMVHVNDRPADFRRTGYGTERVTFDVDLPGLSRGDKIYVAVGPNKSSRYDTFLWNFSVVMTR
ncbi:MAG: FecR family protein, partial [Planctomycetota bacterium]